MDEEKTISAICKRGDTYAQSVDIDGKGFCNRWSDLFDWSMHFKLLYIGAWYGQADGRKLVFFGARTVQCDFDRIQHLSGDYEMGRCRGACADYRFCQFCGSSGY